jgi:hypothetical protein
MMNGAKQIRGQQRSFWFVETRSFTANWGKCGLSVQDLLNMEDAIIADPTRGPVIAGTGGMRKMRYSPDSTNQGKRGGFRVCYAHFERYSGIVLLFVYSKKSSGNLSPAEKKAAKDLLVRLERELQRKYGHL